MSPKSVQRFGDSDMHKNNKPKRGAPFGATRFGSGAIKPAAEGYGKIADARFTAS
jgi:hypothetical protein